MMLNPKFKDEYVNREPITDELVVLDLLYDDRWERLATRSLRLPHGNSLQNVPYVSVGYSERYFAHFLVERGVGEKLLDRCLVQGKKHWGFTDDRDLSITDHGREVVRDTYVYLGVPYNDNFSRRLRSENWYAEFK